MEVSSAVVSRLVDALRECARHVRHGTADQPLGELDAGLLALAGAEKGRLRPSRAAAALEVAFPTVSRHVRDLRDKGLITIAPDTGDGRGYAITLSSAGEQALRGYRDDLSARFGAAMAGWTVTEVTTLADGLSRLAESMPSVSSATTPRTPTAPIWWRTT